LLLTYSSRVCPESKRSCCNHFDYNPSSRALFVKKQSRILYFYLSKYISAVALACCTGNWNINDYDVNEILKASLATLELGILEPRAQILGGVVIFDMNGFTLQHAYQITPRVVSTIFDLIVVCGFRFVFVFFLVFWSRLTAGLYRISRLQFSIPMKTHAIHIINESWAFETAFNLFKPFLGKRYNEIVRIHVYNHRTIIRTSPLHETRKTETSTSR